MVSFAWLRHLKKRRGRHIFGQAYMMYKLHRTPFEEIIGNMIDVTQKHKSGFTFPTVASVAAQKPELLKTIMASGCEIAVHGYKHLKYPLLSVADQENDIRKAIEAYSRLGVKPLGFRAPYNAYSGETPAMIERAGFLWDGGIGYTPENRARGDLFRVPVDGRDSNFVCIPLNKLSDDLMIDELGYTPDQMTSALKQALDEARSLKSVVMFDLHPIRMGQRDNVVVLDRLLEYGRGIGGWFPTVSEAVRFRQSHAGWGRFEFCCLLTGDIDNFYFRDYFKRLL